jgi:hypothetical protein
MRFHQDNLLMMKTIDVKIITSMKRGGETSSVKPQQPYKGAKACTMGEKNKRSPLY